jgi:hypothetical protein
MILTTYYKKLGLTFKALLDSILLGASSIKILQPLQHIEGPYSINKQ